MRRKRKVFKKNQCIDWIFIYGVKSYETNRIVRYKYLIDDDNIDHAGEIEIDKRAVYEIYETFYEKMEHIRNYFEEGFIKILKCPAKRYYSNYGMKDFNAVYVAKIVIEYKYWAEEYGESFSKIVQDHFEIYTKNFVNILDILEHKDKEIVLLPYEMEYYKDYWNYMTFVKTYEDNQILRYHYYIDTEDHDDYATVEFKKDIQISRFKNYSVLYRRLINKKLIFVIRNKDTASYRDYYYEKRCSIIVYYILSHQSNNGNYLSKGVIINQSAYEYYDTVSKAIYKFGYQQEDEIIE